MENVSRASAKTERKKINKIGGLKETKTRITGGTTRPTDIPAEGISETTGHASSDMELSAK